MLIGESLIRAQDIGAKIRELLGTEDEKGEAMMRMCVCGGLGRCC